MFLTVIYQLSHSHICSFLCLLYSALLLLYTTFIQHGCITVGNKQIPPPPDKAAEQLSRSVLSLSLSLPARLDGCLQGGGLRAGAHIPRFP